jgi:FkbH-like protein
VSFLDATRVLREFSGGRTFSLLLTMSGTSTPLELYLRAEAARRQRALQLETLPFGTLHQHLVLAGERTTDREVALLLPWDLVQELDWRTGVTDQPTTHEELWSRAKAVLERLRVREVPIVYIDAPIPPLFMGTGESRRLRAQLSSAVRAAGGEVLPDEMFALPSYLASGVPVAGIQMSRVATALIEAVLPASIVSRKVLVTDLDETLWKGIIGDDGVDGVFSGADERGYPHYLYQTLLKRLRMDGVLLAVVSKNDQEVALGPLRNGRTLLTESDFVAVLASWNPKSAQIEALAEQLNLGLDAFVFVDDNPVEIEEVSRRLPQVACHQFPQQLRDLPALLEAVAADFPRTVVTEEDRARTELYRRRLATMAPREATAEDLHVFLRDLGMTLHIADRGAGPRERAVQLINKTNQFNANGRRFADDEVAAILDAGGRLLTASLADRSGSHGEILTILIDRDAVLRAFVMSCRVFQRRVEHATLGWLASTLALPLRVDYAPTEKNGPFRSFLTGLGASDTHEGLITIDTDRLLSDRAVVQELFQWVPPERA